MNQELNESVNWRLNLWFKNLSDEQLNAFKMYHSELIRFNQHINLISPTTEKNADIIHFSDSLIAISLMFQDGFGDRIYDIGSGNGMPGLILGILDKKRTVICIDKDARKIEFIKYISTSLKLKNIEAIQTKIEELKGEKIEYAVSRAFASVSKSLLITRKIFKSKGVFYQMKANTWINELSEIPSQLCSHWAPRLLGEYKLPITKVERSVIKSIKLTD